MMLMSVVVWTLRVAPLPVPVIALVVAMMVGVYQGWRVEVFLFLGVSHTSCSLCDVVHTFTYGYSGTKPSICL